MERLERLKVCYCFLTAASPLALFWLVESYVLPDHCRFSYVNQKQMELPLSSKIFIPKFEHWNDYIGWLSLHQICLWVFTPITKNDFHWKQLCNCNKTKWKCLTWEYCGKITILILLKFDSNCNSSLSLKPHKSFAFY